jgi:predicted nucleotidyltransferase
VVAGHLAELLSVTYGPMAVRGEVLASVPGVREAYVYGSWAARYRGQGGDVPRDIDMLVVGEADDDDLYDAARTAERRLGGSRDAPSSDACCPDVAAVVSRSVT